jgi:hypothetical protein
MVSQAFLESYLALLSLSENREGKMAEQGSRGTGLKIEAASTLSVSRMLDSTGRNTKSITDRARTAERASGRR